MTSITIKQVTLNDLEQLQKIGIKTFYETFKEYNSDEDMQNYLDTSFNLEKLKAEVSNKDSLFYFAMLDNQVVAYLKVNFGQAQTDLQDPLALELERIYVLKEFLGQKVGQILHDKAIEIAKQHNLDYIWLGVWEHNPRAIQFYKKNGFVEFSQHIFKVGNDEQIDIMMKLLLK
jgi:ribosomal protein S18 acetylase RimI-like enzyme